MARAEPIRKRSHGNGITLSYKVLGGQSADRRMSDQIGGEMMDMRT